VGLSELNQVVIKRLASVSERVMAAEAEAAAVTVTIADGNSNCAGNGLAAAHRPAEVFAAAAVEQAVSACKLSGESMWLTKLSQR